MVHIQKNQSNVKQCNSCHSGIATNQILFQRPVGYQGEGRYVGLTIFICDECLGELKNSIKKES